jgi:serine protease Do
MNNGVTRRRALGALGSALAGAIAGCSVPSEGSARRSDQPAAPETTPPAPTGRYGEVYRQSIDSVATVRVDTGETRGQGTAWVYDEDTLVTNEHVVGEAESVSLWFMDQGWQPGDVIATDVYSDLALVGTDNAPADATALPLAETEPPVGSEVVVIGNPFGLSGSVTTGIVSGVDRTLPAANGFSIPDAIQTDAAINPGNSGGPLMDLDGRVVGVINSGGGDNIGFGISAAMTQRVIPELATSGDYDHSYMGVRLRDVTPPLITANGLDVGYGVYIHEVVDGSPADGMLEGSTGERSVGSATVPTGGDVVVSMAGRTIWNRQALSTTLALETRPGEAVETVVRRDGDEETLSLTLGSRPEP